jgi:molybdate transport system substrate-binding protein
MRRLLALVVVSFLLAFGARAETLTVFAAASLTDALGDVSAAWAAHGHQALRLSFGASSTLARQIEQGAAVNLFASADERWMDYLAQRGLIAPGTRRDLLTNKLVLIVPASHPAHVTIGPGFDLLKLLGPDGRLATGDPAHVPVGIYAEQALRKLGLWPSIEKRLARTDSVRAALLLVERGEAPAGIVYSTDALASSRVVVAGTFPDNTHDRVTYPFALIRDHDSSEARALLDFLSGTEARDIFARRGFGTE